MTLSHIAIVSANIPKQGTGSEIVLLRHVERFCNAGTRVTFIAPEHLAEERHFVHPLYRQMAIRRRAPFWPPVRDWAPLSWALRARLVARDIANKLAGDPPASVLCLLWGEYPRIAAHLARIFDTNLSVVIHDQEELWHLGRRARQIRARNAEVLSRAAWILPVSDEQALSYKVPERKIARLLPIPGSTTYQSTATKGHVKSPTVVTAGSMHDWQLDNFRIVARALDLCSGTFVIVAPEDNKVARAISSEFTCARRIDPFPENEQVVDYVANNATAFLVSYDMGGDRQRWGGTSFPSKLLEFSRADVPPIVICPENTALAEWAHERRLPLFWTRLSETLPEDIAQRLMNCDIMRDATRHIRDVRDAEFDPAKIHSLLCSAL